MKQECISGPNGYKIPCLHTLDGRETRVVLISHGFGSSKRSPTAEMLLEELPLHGVGVLAYDFPTHGESLAPRDALRLDNCLDDMGRAEARIRELAPEAEVLYFSSSFGAYLNLIYLATRPHQGRRAMLRCAAVDMPGLFRRDVEREELAALKRQGYFLLDHGYERPLRIVPGLLEDFDRYDVFRLYRPGTADLAMIHGTDDKTASVQDAQRFAAFAGAELTLVEGGDHSFTIPGGGEKVLAAAVEFFTRDTVEHPEA